MGVQMISAVIATKNRTEQIMRLIESIQKQTIKVEEILIIDQSQNDYSNLFLYNPNIHYYHTPEIEGLTMARNFGIDNSIGEYVLFLDDDLELLEDFNEKILLLFKSYPDVIGICGTQITYLNRSSFYLRISRLFKIGPFRPEYSKKDQYNSISFRRMNKISGGITMYRRSILNEHRFDENMIGYCLGEDADYSYSIQKYGVLLKSFEAKAHHYHNPSGRINLIEDYDSRICFYNYFYSKHLKTNTNKHQYFFCFLWVIIGVILDGLYKSIKLKSLDPIKGILSGFMRSKNGYRGAKCLKLKI